MSYYEAKEALNENSRLHLDVQTNPKEWNTNVALFNLTEALDNDLSRIHALLREILHELQRLK